MVRRIIRQEITAITMATLESNQSETRSTFKRYDSEPSITNNRVISPYGFASKAPSGTQCLVVPIAGQATNVSILGHFDQSRPPLQDGEAVLYGADGQVILMKSGGTIHQGSEAASEPVVLGNVLLQALTDLYTTLTTDPLGLDSFALPVYISTAIKQQLLDQKSKYVDTNTTNVVGQKNFVERGS